MRGKRKVIYWDSCTFLAWIGDEPRPIEDKDGLNECVKDIMRNAIILITSDIVRTEVLVHGKPSVAEKFELITKRRNVDILSPDPRIITISSELRDYYVRQRAIDRKPILDVPDSIHLATAINYEADAYYTFDAGKKRSRSLLSLSGNVGGKYPLLICKPPPPAHIILELPYAKKDE